MAEAGAACRKAEGNRRPMDLVDECSVLLCLHNRGSDVELVDVLSAQQVKRRPMDLVEVELVDLQGKKII